MFCTKCGNSLADDAKFCTKCGNQMEAKAEVKEEAVEETKVEETVETPVEETPAEETPVEETPAEETPVEETPAEETPAEEVPTEEAPVEETTVAEETTVEDNPALKKSNSGKLFIIIGVIAGGVVILAVVFLVLWITVFSNMIAMNKYKTALEENDYKSAKELVKDKIKDSKYEDEAAELLAGELDELKEKVANGDMSLEDLKEEYADICKIKLDIDDEVEEFNEFISKLEASQRAFDEGQNYYDGAYSVLKSVIKEDGKNYKDAKSMISECEDKIVDNALENAQSYVGYYSYSAAISVLNECKEIVGNDNKKLNDAYGKIEELIVESAINNCNSAIGNGWYDSALSYINDALTYFPENKELKKKAKECAESYAEASFNNFVENIGYYDNAQDLADNVTRYMESSGLEEYQSYLKAKLVEYAKTYETPIIENLKAGDIYKAKFLIEMLGAIDPENAMYVKCKEAYEGKFEYATLTDLEYSVTSGYVYTYNNMRDFNDVIYYNIAEMTEYWGENISTFNVTVTGYKSISGRINMSQQDGLKGKIIITAANKTLLSVDVDGTTNNLPFNVEIPDGTTVVTFKYVEAAESSGGTAYIGNLVFGKEYFDVANDATLKELSGEPATESQDETVTEPEEGETEEGETVEGETTEGETAEGETTEGETAEGETAEGETTEGETAEGETTEGEAVEGETTDESVDSSDSTAVSTSAPVAE